LPPEPSAHAADANLPAGDGAAWPASDAMQMQISVCFAVDDECHEVVSQISYAAAPSGQVVVLDLSLPEEEAGEFLRIIPLTCPAVVTISRITLAKAQSGEVVWQASAPQEFDQFKVAGTASRLPNGKHFRLVSFGDLPQLFLPLAPLKLREDSLRLEICLAVALARPLVEEALASVTSTLPGWAIGGAIPYLGLCADDPTDNFLLYAPLRIGELQTVRFENVESLCSLPHCRLRLQPLYHPAFLKISRIAIVRPAGDLVVFAADSAEQFQRMEMPGGAIGRIVDGKLLVIIHEGQYLAFPSLEIPGHESCRLELQLESLRVPPILPPPSRSAGEALFQAVDLPSRISLERAPQMEGFSLNALEFDNVDSALDYALTHPRAQAALSDHQALIHAATVPLPDTIEIKPKR
jgi:hypothetical protein